MKKVDQIDELVIDLNKVFDKHLTEIEDPVIIASVYFALAMFKMRTHLNLEEFHDFLDEVDNIKESLKAGKGLVFTYDDDDDNTPTFH